MKTIRTIKLNVLAKGKVLSPSDMKNVKGGTPYYGMCCDYYYVIGVTCYRIDVICDGITCSGWCES